MYKLHKFAVFVLISGLASLSWGKSPRSINRLGNRLYKKGKYKEAFEKYRKAQIRLPDEDILTFNQGCALYKKGAVDTAGGQFLKVISSLKGRKLYEASYYNLGNSLLKKGDLKAAIESYKKALRIDPRDKDAKYNLELAQKIAKQAKQKQSKENENKNKGEKKKKQQQKKKQERQKQKKELSKEEIKRILNAVKENEKKAKQKSRAKAGKARVRVLKDW
jgi:Ca-activated chloride channel family protein